jgi:hypothetical protein
MFEDVEAALTRQRQVEEYCVGLFGGDLAQPLFAGFRFRR